MRLSVNHINKEDFLHLYQQSRIEALHGQNIQSGFAATGLVPYNPDRVLSLLQTQLQTPTPPPLPLEADWVTETPHNTHDLQCQAELLKSYIRHCTKSPPSLTEQAFNQLIKGCQLAMNSAVLLVHENNKLRVENERQKRKRGRKRKYVAKGGLLTISDGISLKQSGQIA
jgi:hypothetical protein